MSHNKQTALVVLTLLAFLSFGCFELTSVPGVSVSPDGSLMYFLDGSLMNEGRSFGTLTSLDISSGQKEVIMASNDSDLVTAFDVNPTNGDIAFVFSSKADGTKIMLYNPAAGPREVTSSGALPNTSLGTMMEFSPNGMYLAVTLLEVPEGFEGGFDISTMDDSSDLTPEQIAAMKSTLYIVALDGGGVKQVSNPETDWVSTLSWNPSGTMLAYNVWSDSDGDGLISTFSFLTALEGGGTGDLSQIYVYDLGSGSSTQVETGVVNYSPEFVSDTGVAYVEFNLMGAMMGGAPSAIGLYDVNSGTTSQVHEAAGLVLGIARSPDGSQVAWTETGATDVTGESDSEDSPNYLYVASPDFSDSRQVTEIVEEGTFMVDVPVWMPDGASVLIASTNVFGSLMGTMGSAFGEIASGFGADVDTDELPGQQVLRVDVGSGETAVIYKGAMSNPSLLAGFLSLATSNLEGLE